MTRPKKVAKTIKDYVEVSFDKQAGVQRGGDLGRLRGRGPRPASSSPVKCRT